MTGVPPRRRAALGVTHDAIVEKPFELEALDSHCPQHDRGAAAMRIVARRGQLRRDGGRAAAAAPLALAIGNFDGVHLGHAALLAEARARAARRGGAVRRC